MKYGNLDVVDVRKTEKTQRRWRRERKWRRYRKRKWRKEKKSGRKRRRNRKKGSSEHLNGDNCKAHRAFNRACWGPLLIRLIVLFALPINFFIPRIFLFSIHFCTLSLFVSLFFLIFLELFSIYKYLIFYYWFHHLIDFICLINLNNSFHSHILFFIFQHLSFLRFIVFFIFYFLE